MDCNQYYFAVFMELHQANKTILSLSLFIGCKVFRRYPSSFADGGREQAQFVDSIIECQDLCINDERCKAFDFRLKTLKCILHFRDKARKTGTDVEHFIKQQCGCKFKLHKLI